MARQINKNRSHKSRDIEDHIVAETKVVEKDVADAPVKDINWEAKQGEVHSSTNLEDDLGYGKAVVIRHFDFKANPESFAKQTPSRQELFNAHASQIEFMLMKDGLKVMPEVAPRLQLSKNKNFYRIVVGAEPMRGFLLHDKPNTLTELANGKPRTDSV